MLTLRDPVLSHALTEALRLARDRGHRLYMVGGTVRDLILKRRPRDLDLVVTGDLTSWIQQFAQALKSRVVTMGKDSFFTCRVPVKGRNIDVWELRKCSVEEDAWRRDFSINAIYYAPSTTEWIDPVNGRKDLKNRMIRSLSLQTFRDDPVRMLRAIRFKVELRNFAIDRGTFLAVTENAHLLGKAAMERVSHELDAILASPSPYEGLLLLDETGCMEEILPEVTAMRGVMQNSFHPDDVYTHTLAAVQMADEAIGMLQPHIREPFSDLDRLTIIHALLLHDVGKPASRTVNDEGEVHFYRHANISHAITESLARRLRWSRAHTARVCKLVSSHMRPLQLMLNGCPDRGVRRLIHRMGEDLPLLLAHFVADRFSRGYDETALACTLAILEEYSASGDAIIHPERLVTGDEIMEILDLPEGPDVGKILASITRRQVEGEISSREEAMTLLHRIRERRSKPS